MTSSLQHQLLVRVASHPVDSQRQLCREGDGNQTSDSTSARFHDFCNLFLEFVITTSESAFQVRRESDARGEGKRTPIHKTSRCKVLLLFSFLIFAFPYLVMTVFGVSIIRLLCVWLVENPNGVSVFLSLPQALSFVSKPER